MMTDAARAAGRVYGTERLVALAGVDFGPAGCWALAAMALRMLGLDVPGDPGEVLAMVGRGELACEPVTPRVLPRLGDVWMLEYTDSRGVLRQHVAVCVDAFRAVHTDAGGLGRVSKLEAIGRAYRVAGRYRPVLEPAAPAKPAAAPARLFGGSYR